MGSIKKIKRNHKRHAVISEAIVSSNLGILLLRRSSANDLYVGSWQLPGGKAKRGETSLRALKREIFEETGCDCSKLKLVKSIVFNELYRGEDSEVKLNVYSCKISGEICLSVDHSKARFVKKSNLKNYPLSPVSKKALFG